MVARAECSGSQCIESDMELPSELPISFIQPDSSVPLKDTERSSRMHSHCTSLEKQTLVSNSSVNVVIPAFTRTVISAPISSSIPGMNKIHTFCTQKSFRLAAWKISGKDCEVLRRCLTFSSPRGEKARQANMRVLGDHGVAGMTLGRLITFQHLPKTF